MRKSRSDGVPACQLGPMFMLLVVLAVVGRFAIVGPDCQWLVALGDYVFANRLVPIGLPYAAAPTNDWVNAVVLAEVLFAMLHWFGDAGLVLAQLAADALALTYIVRGADRLGATERATAAIMLLVALGSLPSLVIIRLQIFSLVLFSVLILLLRSDTTGQAAGYGCSCRSSPLWSNLHGAVLMGIAVAGCYLLFPD